jgi:hypothetical protein
MIVARNLQPDKAEDYIFANDRNVKICHRLYDGVTTDGEM